MRAALLLAIGAAFSLGSAARAAVVSACGTDVAGGPKAPNLARALALGGAVTFTCPPNARTITFTRTYAISRDTTLSGAGGIVLDGAGRRMFDLAAGVRLQLADVAIRRGRVVVLGKGDLRLDRVSIRDSLAPLRISSGNVVIRDSRFEGNDDVVLFAFQSTTQVERSRFEGNRAMPLHVWRGRVSVDRSLFVANDMPSVFISGDCQVLIRNSQFNANVRTGSGGALALHCPATIEFSSFRNNRATTGGAIYVGPKASLVSLRRVVFAGNRADGLGGAIAARASMSERPRLQIRASRFETNGAQDGGAIALRADVQGGPILEAGGVSFRGNGAARQGGAVYLYESRASFVNTTFTGNQAGDGGGGLHLGPRVRRPQAPGSPPPAQAILANVIFAGNRADRGGSAFQGDSASFINATIVRNSGVAVWPEGRPGALSPGTAIRFRNTILAGDAAPCSAAGGVVYADDGANLQFPGTSCGAGMMTGNPWLGPFLAPLPWSPAAQLGDPAACAAAPVRGRDIYGVERPLLDRCASGAVEGDLPRLAGRFARLHAEPGAAGARPFSWVSLLRNGSPRRPAGR